MHIRPLHDRILIQRLEEAEQQVGGIFIIVKEEEVLAAIENVSTAKGASRKR
jgi:co-chaperonin GroES (HSP10)